MKNKQRNLRLTALHFCFLFVLLFLTICVKIHAEVRKDGGEMASYAHCIPEGLTHDLPADELCFILFYDEDTYFSRKMEQNLSRLAEGKSDDVGFYKVNGPANESLCIEYNIIGFPSVAILKKGEVCNCILGHTSYSNLRHIYNRNR